MKRVFLSSVTLAALAITGPAFGADISTPYTKARPMVAPAYDWSGYYIGVFGGGGYGNHNLTNATGPAGFANFTENYSSSGPLGGGFAGYNVQYGSSVVGIEGDYAAARIKGSDNFTPGPSNNLTNLNSVATVRARAGIAVDDLLLVFSGGWAYGSMKQTAVGPLVTDQFTVNKSGYTVGGGIEYAATQSLIAKVEYRYYNFGSFSRAGTPLTPDGQLPYSVSNSYSAVLVGLSYKFGGPVVVKF